MLFADKVVVVTGAAGGIGWETVKSFARCRAEVVACARKPSDDFIRDLTTLPEGANNVTPVYFDLAEEAAVGAKQILNRWKKIDVLVNIAGMTHSGLFQMTPTAVAQTIFNVNFFAPYSLTQYLLKRMGSGGSIINIASTAAIEANTGLSAYAGSKAALIAWSKCLARELGAAGIRVNVVAPGITRTKMLRNLSESELEKRIAGSAIKHIGEPSDIAEAILFLASNRAKYITGQVLRVDGGL